MKIVDVANTIKASNQDSRAVLIAIEGFGGSGKSTIANKLADTLNNAFVISIDDFIIKENFNKNGWDDQVFDRSRLEEQVLKPTSENRPLSYQKLIWDTNLLSNPINVPRVKYLIIEGISSYHPSISQYYDFKIWVDTAIDVAKSRGKARDAGNENEKYWDFWADNDLAYQQKYHSKEIADFVVVND